MVVILEAGAEKTLGYILPAIVHINNQPILKRGDGPIALVLAPTRELAKQIQEIANGFFSASNVRNACIFSGSSKVPQERDLKNGCEIVIATPGRLINFLDSGTTNLRRCTYLVLDEADVMLGRGFESKVRTILSKVRPDRQILMLSTTWPEEVKRFANDIIGTRIEFSIGMSISPRNFPINKIVHESSQYDEPIIKAIRAPSNSSDSAVSGRPSSGISFHHNEIIRCAEVLRRIGMNENPAVAKKYSHILTTINYLVGQIEKELNETIP